MKLTTFIAIDHPNIEELESLLKDKLGEKYTYKITKKSSSLAGKLINGVKADSITVIKNAYHRTVITIKTTKNTAHKDGKYTNIYFSESTLAGWLGFLHKEGGFIGALIIKAIYGSDKGFYEEVESTVKTNINGQDETLEVGLGALFNKKKDN